MISTALGTVVTVAFNYFRNTIICIYPHCQFDFETLLFLSGGDHVSTRNGRAPAAGGAACASRGLLRPNQPRPMDGASLLRPRQYVLPDPVGLCGVSSDHPWHRFPGDQGTLRQEGTWSDSDRRRTSEASVCD